jgi:membrane protease YdiL (CAAX protease family)
MNDAFDSNPEGDLPPDPHEPVEPLAVRPKKKGFSLVAWLIILVLVGLMVARSTLGGGAAETAQKERLQLILFELQARYLVGAGNFIPGQEQQLLAQAKSLAGGSWEQRLRYSVVSGELGGPQEGLNKALDVRTEIRERDDMGVGTPADKERRVAQKRLAVLVVNLYRDYVAGDFRAPTLSDNDREFLRRELAWFGDLALHPRQALQGHPGLAAAGGPAPAVVLEPLQGDPAARAEVLAPAYATLFTVLFTFLGGCFFGVVGFVALVIFLVLAAKRKLTAGLDCGSRHGGVYAETFALYMLFFLGFSLWLHMLPLEVPPLMGASLVTVGSLLALGWPVLRGIRWTQVRQDIGWTLGRSPVLEPAMGVAAYVMTLPILAVGLLVTLLLMALTKQEGGLGLGTLADDQPVHPIVEFIVNGSTLDRFFVFFDACLLAPLVEETMFRGVLYRHLRELSCRWSTAASVVFSGTVVSFIFAVIHPQGLVAVPVLMALAYGFTIAREWRGTLIPSMVAHGLNNALVVLFVLLVMKG